MRSSKSRQTLPHSQSFDAIGTKWQIETLNSMSPALLIAIHDCIELFDKTYSRFRADSLISKIARQSGTYDFPEDVVPIISFYRSLYEATGGQITPLIGSALENAGYDAKYSFQPKKQTKIPTWDEAMTWSGNCVVILKPITIDIGAAGKGYLIDKISAILDKDRIEEYVIDASGDILHKGASEDVIGLEHPTDPLKVIGAIPIQNHSLCASASNRRTWGKGLHHIFNPRTMKPTHKIIATWVIAKQAMVADGLATALFFTDPDILKQSYDFQYARMHRDGSVDYSSQFEGALFT